MKFKQRAAKDYLLFVKLIMPLAFLGTFGFGVATYFKFNLQDQEEHQNKLAHYKKYPPKEIKIVPDPNLTFESNKQLHPQHLLFSEEQLKRFKKGETIKFKMTQEQYVGSPVQRSYWTIFKHSDFYTFWGLGMVSLYGAVLVFRFLRYMPRLFRWAIKSHKTIRDVANEK